MNRRSTPLKILAQRREQCLTGESLHSWHYFADDNLDAAAASSGMPSVPAVPDFRS